MNKPEWVKSSGHFVPAELADWGAPISYGDKVLPTQPFFADHYRGSNYADALASFINKFSEQSQFKLLPVDRREELSSAPPSIAVLKFLATAMRAKYILELGTFVGNTTMHLASLSTTLVVTTVDCCQEFCDVARVNICDNNLQHKVLVAQSDIGEFLKACKFDYDLIFVDGAKQNYLQYVQAIRHNRLLRPCGVIVVDDVFFHGDALNSVPTTEKGLGCKQLLEAVKGWSVPHCLLPIGNGMLLLGG